MWLCSQNSGRGSQKESDDGARRNEKLLSFDLNVLYVWRRLSELGYGESVGSYFSVFLMISRAASN